MTSVIVGLVALLVGVAAGFLIRASMARSGARTIEARATTTLTNARQESDQIRREAEQVRVQAEQEAAQTLRRSLEEAKSDAAQIRREAEEDVKARREEIARLERRIGEAEDEIRTRTQRLDARAEELQERDERLAEVRARLERAAEQHRAQLERVAGMTSAEARETLVSEVVDDAKRSAMTQVREIEQRAREEGEERARKILTVAIQRVASEQTAESTVAVFTLPSEDMKGRIIGREGRNIRAFEAATGVNIIIDDTPEAVVLSSFDPVRREAARLTLEKLVADGRIHPARIEEVHERSLAEIDERIRRAGEDAVAEVGITDIHPEMVKLLGRLQFRTSYGQNVLKHLVESAHIASSLAAELGVDPTVAKRGAFLHDVGKAVTHEVEGSHAIIGAEIARRMREDPEVVHCIESHHGEVEQRTIHAVLAQIADSISGGRPGARRESLETYVKRLERLEEICNAFEGVEKVYAMQAGREVRVLVQPQDVDDIQAQVIARDIAKQVEEELQYPGQIRITVVRETRATEYAR
jgi:ribonuclease Y